MKNNWSPLHHHLAVRVWIRPLAIVCALLLVGFLLGGCATGSQSVPERDGTPRSRTDVAPGDESPGDESLAASAGQAAQDPAPRVPDSATLTPAASATSSPAGAPGPISIDPAAGVPLEALFNPYEGLRLRYTMLPDPDTAADNPDSDAGVTAADAPQVILILQPSRGSRADISVHYSDDESWLIMEESETLWRPTADSTDDPLAAALAELVWPRFLPSGSTPYHTEGEGAFLVRLAPADDESVQYSIEYASGAHAVLAAFPVEPGSLPGGGPALISVDTAAMGPVVLELESAAIFREREVAGVVVSAQGRPLPGIAVAPHPAVGRLAPSRVARTDTFGRFVLPMRVAPGDSLQLYFGRTDGEGSDAYIVSPQVSRGRADTADFATLIYTGR